MQRRGFDPPLKSFFFFFFFLVEGIFLLGLTWILTPISQNSFGWEYKPKSSLCTHAIHRTDPKDPEVYVLNGWMPATKPYPAKNTHEDGMWLSRWLDQKRSYWQKSHPKMVKPRDIAGDAEEVHAVKTTCFLEAETRRMFLLFVGCLTSQQHASVSQELLRQFYVLPHWEKS